MKKLLVGLLALSSLSAFAADCDSLVGEYLCSSKYSKQTIQIEKASRGYRVIEISHTATPFSEPNSTSYFDPKCVADNKLDYKESYFAATFFIKIRPSSEGIQMESGFAGAKETGIENCIKK